MQLIATADTSPRNGVIFMGMAILSCGVAVGNAGDYAAAVLVIGHWLLASSPKYQRVVIGTFSHHPQPEEIKARKI
jgi:hypothetical protein